MFFGKRRKETAKGAKRDAIKVTDRPISEHASSEPSEVLVAAAKPTASQFSPALLTVTDIAQLELAPGRPATGKVENGWLQLGAKDGGRTFEAHPAREGDVFCGVAATVLIDAGANGKPSRYMFGPVFLDAEGNVLAWWKPFDKPSSEVSEIVATTTAPAGSASVSLGVRGTYDSKGEPGDYVVGFANARLVKVIG